MKKLGGAGASTIVLVIGVICVGFLMAVPLYKMINEGSLSASDAVDATLEDIEFHIYSLSVVDAGVHRYTAPDKVSITVGAGTITVSHDDYTGSAGFVQKLAPGEVSGQRFCIVKSRAGGKSTISICDGGNSACCTPRLG